MLSISNSSEYPPTAARSTTALAQHLAADKNLTTSLHRLILFIRL